MIFGISRKFRSGKRKRRCTGLDALQDVIFEFILVGFLVHDPDLVFRPETAFHVIHFHGDIRTDFSLDHKARVIGKRRAGEQVVLGATRSVILFAAARKPDVHRPLQQELRLVQPKVLHPRGHVDGNVDVVESCAFRGGIATVLLASKGV